MLLRGELHEFSLKQYLKVASDLRNPLDLI